MTIELIPTGVQFLDDLLGGGQLPQGVHGLLGPNDGGNDLLAIMIAVEGARRQYEQARIGGNDCGRWIFVTLCRRARHVWRIAYSHGAEIERSVLRDPRNFIEQREAFWCEGARAHELYGAVFESSSRERFERARQFLGRHWHVLDLSTGISAPLNQRPVDFLSAQLEAIAKYGPIRGVVIDSLDTLVTQFPPVGDETSDERLRDLIGSFAHEARGQIADRYRCPVWLVHALNGVAKMRSPAAWQSHLDAADCDDFGDGLDACVALGNMEREENCFLIHCSKSPVEREVGSKVVQLDTWFDSIVDVCEDL